MRAIDRAGFRHLSPPVNPAPFSLSPSILTSLPSPTSHLRSLFPLPLISYPTRPSASSRRVAQSHARSCCVVSQANQSIRALNTLYFNAPSPLFISRLQCRSTVPSAAQRRIHASIHTAAADYFYSCRRLCKQSSSGHHAHTRPAPRAGMSSASQPVRGDSSSSSSLVIMLPRPLSSQEPASLTGASSSSRISSTAFDLSTSLQAFDAVRDTSTAPVGLPSSYDSHTSTGVLPIIADRVSLPDNLQHVSILGTLPESVSACYASSTDLLLPADVAAERVAAARLRRPRVLAARGEYVKLVRRMLRLGMLQLTDAPRCVNSLFGVPKGDDIRLILDARLANCHFVDAPRVNLPSPAHLAQLQARGTFAVAKCDLSNFYHQLVLPQWIRTYFALPALKPREQAFLASCTDLSPAIRSALQHSRRRIFPACVTLPMGFSHSVFLAQCVHEHVIYSYSTLSPRDNILNLVSPLIDRPLHALYVDDCVLMGPSTASVSEQYASVQAAYARVLLPVKASKCTEATTAAVTVLGVDISGERGTISLSIDRHHRIVQATAALLSQPLVSAGELARVLGGWTWELLLRRPALSVLKHAYRFVDRFMDRAPRPLWRSVARELTVLVALSPLLSVNLRAAWAPHIVATDASLSAAGVVASPLSADTLHALWPLTTVQLPSLIQQRQQPSLSAAPWTSLQQPAKAAFPSAPSEAAIQHAVQACRWSTIISAPWQTHDHINGLELEALHLGLRWCASRPASIGARLPFLVDSSVAYYIVRKGRTSTPHLLSIFRRCSALTLALSASMAPVWLPSQLNPADAPSRSLHALASGSHQLASEP